MPPDVSKPPTKAKPSIEDYLKVIGFIGGVVLLVYHLVFGFPKYDQMTHKQLVADQQAKARHIAEVKREQAKEHALEIVKQQSELVAMPTHPPKQPTPHYDATLDAAVYSVIYGSSSSSKKTSTKSSSTKKSKKKSTTTGASSVGYSQTQDEAIRTQHTKQDFPNANVIGGTTVTANLSTSNPYALSH